MLTLDEEHDTCGLRVEGRWHVEEGLVDDLLNLGIGDGALLLESVYGTAGSNGLKECV